jgi:hypothetical protein
MDMKFKVTLLTLLAVATMPFIASAQNVPAGRGPLTDSQQSQMAGREQRMARPDLRAKVLSFGYINTDGSIASGSGNFTASYDSTNVRYSIAISGVSYFFSSFSTTVTPSIPIAGTECRTDSLGGKLLVQCYNLAGSPVQAAFGFITF